MKKNDINYFVLLKIKKKQAPFKIVSRNGAQENPITAPLITLVVF